VFGVSSNFRKLQQLLPTYPYQQYYRVQGSLACLSLVGSGMIILSFFMMKALRQHPISLVFWLSVCDFMFSLKFAITAVLPDSATQIEDSTFCLITALMGQVILFSQISPLEAT